MADRNNDDETVNTLGTEEDQIHDQLPSVEEARFGSAASGTVYHQDDRGGIRRKMWLILIGVVVVLAVVITVAVRLSQDNGDSRESRVEHVVVFLKDYSDPQALSDVGSPQYRAAEWIADEDDQFYELHHPQFVQRYAVVVFYYALGGERWKKQWNFLSDRDECLWNVLFTASDPPIPFGVGCSEDKEIITIVLEDNNLVGSLPPEMGLLSSMNFIWLPDNTIVGEFPNELKELTNMDALNLDRNAMFGSIPTWIGGWTDASFLSLQQNKFTGNVPSQVGLLKSLVRLELEVNELTGTIPTELKNCKLLEMITLGRNEFVGELTPWLAPDFEYLFGLGLNNNNFTGPIPTTVGNLTSLKRIYLDDNDLTGDVSVLNQLVGLEAIFLEDNLFEQDIGDGSFFTNMPNLKILDASDNKFFGDFPAHLLSHYFLQILDLHGNSLGGTLPVDIPVNTALEYLALHDNMLTNTIPSAISNLQVLRHLDLSTNQFNGEIPDPLGDVASLVYLFLAENPLKAGEFPESLQQLSNLRELSLKQTNLMGTIPSALVDLDKLVLLDLDNNGLVGTIPQNLGDIDSLRFLLLNRNNLNGTLPSSIQNLPYIRLLLIEQNDIIGGVGPLCNDDQLRANLAVLGSDCGGDNAQVDCPCCTLCCEDGVDETCNDGNMLANSDPNWESRYNRVVWDFTSRLDDIY